jgi:hypothetical protein
MKILYLHGSDSKPGGVKPTHLATHGHGVVNPALDDEDFTAALATAQGVFDAAHPDLVVGSSRGGAVAMNIATGGAPLLLLCPAWKRWGTARTVKPTTIILHSSQDDVVPVADSQELLTNSGLPAAALVHVGADHRLADPPALAAMRWACGLLGSGESLPWLEDQSQLPQITLGNGSAAFCERIRTEIIPWVQRSTIPFFHLRKDPTTNEHGIVDKDRTGVFLRIGGDHFVLTASHGIREAVASETYLFMSWDDDEHCFLPLADDQIATTDQATLDVAAIKLSESNSARLLKCHTPISLLDIARPSFNSDGMFLIVGYPRAGTEFVKQSPLAELQEPRLETLKYVGKRSASRWTGEGLTYSPLMHLVIWMPQDSYLAALGRGELLPEHEGIQGISGCGIWLVADRRKKKPLDSIRLEDCKLVAIEHTYDQDAGLVAGTWIGLALMLIADRFPETRPAMKLVYL